MSASVGIGLDRSLCYLVDPNVRDEATRSPGDAFQKLVPDGSVAFEELRWTRGIAVPFRGETRDDPPRFVARRSV